MRSNDLRNTSGLAITTDGTGNVYTTGVFTGTVDFDPGPGVYNLRAFGIEDVFISKLDEKGNFVWAKHFGGPDSASARGRAITVDAAGNIYTTGDFAKGTIDFDPGPEVFNLTSYWSCFVSKLNADGNFIYAKQLGEGSNGTTIKVDGSGNVYTAGLFSGVTDFDPGPGVFNLGRFAPRVFVSKLDVLGNFVWAKQLGGIDSLGNIDYPLSDNVSLALDGSGNIFIAGSFRYMQDFDPGPGYAILTASLANDSHDIFVCKLNGDGNFVWVKQMGGTGEDYSVSIVIGSSNDIYTCGYFSGAADFDPGNQTFNLTAANSFPDIFISKLDNNGNFIWARQLGGNQQVCYSVTVDNAGGIYTTGYFGNTLDFDPGPGTFNLTATGYDIFVLKLDESGKFIWAKQIGGNGTIISNSIAADALGNVYTTGYFSGGPIDFDPGIGAHDLSADTGSDIFVLKMKQCINSSYAVTASTCHTYTLNGQTYDTSGVYTQTLINAKGCDSIITLTLTVDRKSSEVTIASCKGITQNNHTYNTSGTYVDTLIAANGCDSIVTLHLTISPLRSNISTSICFGQSYEGYSASGIYIDTFITADGCDSIRTLALNLLSEPSPYLGADTSLCAGDSLVLYPGDFITYTWQDGSTQNRITVTKPGLYSVSVADNCGAARDEIVVKEGVCDIYFPSAFTPNNDGRNDFFKILGASDINEYHLKVYNRWGQIVFETTEPANGWNGTINGQLQNVGVYAWRCNFKKSGSSRYMNGTVVLLK
jgi:gliding motility-associated-like protein